jgi:hypothetical protein
MLALWAQEARAAKGSESDRGGWMASHDDEAGFELDEPSFDDDPLEEWQEDDLLRETSLDEDGEEISGDY